MFELNEELLDILNQGFGVRVEYTSMNIIVRVSYRGNYSQIYLTPLEVSAANFDLISLSIKRCVDAVLDM